MPPDAQASHLIIRLLPITVEREREREMRMEGVDMEAKEKSKVVIRCAKAALLLSAIKSFPNRSLNCEEYDRFEEDEMLRRKIGELKIALVRERLKTKRIKLCGLMEVVLQIALVLSLSTFFLTLA